VTYPTTAPEIALPELDGKTAKMYRGGKICLTDHFKPLWARNAPKFGIAHAMALGVSFFFFVSNKFELKSARTFL
jgi:ufm1-conjugating enzyme 1